MTGLFSFFAYIWLLVILRFITPDVVDLWEASVTFALFPILVFFAYAADRGWCGLKALRPRTKQQLELGPLQGEQSEFELSVMSTFVLYFVNVLQTNCTLDS